MKYYHSVKLRPSVTGRLGLIYSTSWDAATDNSTRLFFMSESELFYHDFWLAFYRGHDLAQLLDLQTSNINADVRLVIIPDILLELYNASGLAGGYLSITANFKSLSNTDIRMLMNDPII